MEYEKRPGGLTALAVFNFIGAAIGCLIFIGMAITPLMLNNISPDQITPEQQAHIEALKEAGISYFVIMLILILISNVLEIISGIGYIKQKRVMGWIVGNIYAIFSIVTSVITGFLMKPELGGGFNLGSIIGFIYPVLTLILLNLTFKEDFPN